MSVSKCDVQMLSDGRRGVRAMVSVEVVGPPEALTGSTRPASAPHQPSTINHQPLLDFIASTGRTDRYGEIIEPEGWRLEAYRKNPVFQNAHNYGDILFTLGRALITEVRSGPSTLNSQPSTFLFQRIEFAVEVNPIARIAYGLYKGGFLRAVSVGFIPIRWEDGGQDAAFSRRYLEQELIEVSAVAVPANPEALLLGLKSGAVDEEAARQALELLGSVCGPKGPEGPAVLDFARALRDALGR